MATFAEVEVVPAIFGAAAGLAGLLLVFLGVSIAAFQSLGLVTVAVSFAWLLSPHRALRDLAAVLFAVELAATASAAVTTARVALWR